MDMDTKGMGARRFIVAGSFIDGSGAEVGRNVFLAVQDGIITAIGAAADLAAVDGAAIDDLSHCTILPALVDCSVSLAQSPSLDSKVRLAAEEADLAQKVAMVEKHIYYCHVYGVLAVADSGDNALLDRYRQGLASAAIIDIRTSGPLLRSRHSGPATSAGRDFIKIAYSGNIEDDEATYYRLNHDDLSELLRHRGGKKAVVVANGRRQVAEALAVGCDAIEQGYGMGEDNLRHMADKGVLWIPSLLRAKNALDNAASGGSVCCRFSQRYVAPGKPLPGADALWKKTLAEQLSQLRLARELGVTTAVGTGAGSAGLLHGESMVEEMKLFIKAGYSLAETICCASANGARFFAMDRLGSLAVGRPATFLVSRGTVKQLPRKLSYLEGIYVDGAPSTTYRKNPVKTGF